MGNEPNFPRCPTSSRSRPKSKMSEWTTYLKTNHKKPQNRHRFWAMGPKPGHGGDQNLVTYWSQGCQNLVTQIIPKARQGLALQNRERDFYITPNLTCDGVWPKMAKIKPGRAQQLVMLRWLACRHTPNRSWEAYKYIADSIDGAQPNQSLTKGLSSEAQWYVCPFNARRHAATK